MPPLEHRSNSLAGESTCPTFLFPQKHAIQFARDGLRHGRERADGMAIDEGFGGGFQDFQAVESLQNVTASDQDAVVFQQGGGAAWREAGGQRFGVAELQSVRKASNLADDDVAFRNGAAGQLRARGAGGGGGER